MIRLGAFLITVLCVLYAYDGRAQEGPAVVGSSEKEEACTPEELDLSEFPDGRAARFERRAERIQAMDQDCDGVLQAEELEAGIFRRFENFDSDKDGFLDQGESASLLRSVTGPYENLGRGLREKKTRKMYNKINKMDKNNDGKISREEYQSHYQRRYEKLDDDGDGALDIREFKAESESSRNRRNNRDQDND